MKALEPGREGHLNSPQPLSPEVAPVIGLDGFHKWEGYQQTPSSTNSSWKEEVPCLVLGPRRLLWDTQKLSSVAAPPDPPNSHFFSGGQEQEKYNEGNLRIHFLQRLKTYQRPKRQTLKLPGSRHARPVPTAPKHKARTLCCFC